MPGTYRVQLFKRIDGVETALGDPQPFNVVPLYLSTMTENDRREVLAFQKRAAKLQREAMGASNLVSDALTRVQYIRRALDQIEGGDAQLTARVNALDMSLRDISETLNGDTIRQQRSEPAPPSLLDRVNNSVTGLLSTQPPTQTHRESLTLAEQQFGPLAERLRQLIDSELASIEKRMNELGAPWTPGRLPR